MSKLLGNLSRGLPFVLSAPSGTGKTTLVRMLIKEFDCVVESVSCTTRPIRPKELPGVDYHFLSKEDFQQKEQAGEFLESAEVFGNRYGTSARDVDAQLSQGKHVFLVIDTQGAHTLRQRGWKAVYIFLKPHSPEVLKTRLHDRQTESSELIEQRLAWAEGELKAQKEYDYLIVNDHLETAYTVLKSIVIAEEHRNRGEI